MTYTFLFNAQSRSVVDWSRTHVILMGHLNDCLIKPEILFLADFVREKAGVVAKFIK
jgi:hypothetical protein